MLLSTGTLETGPALTGDYLIELQRTVGNRALAAVIQRAPGDEEDQAGATSVPAVSMPARDRSPGTQGKQEEDPSAMLPDPAVIVPVGGGAGPSPAPKPVPAGHGGGVDQAGRAYLKVVPHAVVDGKVRAQYRKDPSTVVRSPSVNWHEEMWLQMKLPDQPEEAPVAFAAGRLIAVHPRYPGPATGIPSSYKGDDKTGLGAPQGATDTPLDHTAPRPERPLIRAAAPAVGGAPGFGGVPGFSEGPQRPGRPVAQPASAVEVFAALKANPGSVMRSPTDEWHEQGFRLDQGKGSTAPTAYKVEGIIIIAPNYPIKGVPTLAVGSKPGAPATSGPPAAPSTGGPAPAAGSGPAGNTGGRRRKGDLSVTKGAPGAAGELMSENESVEGDTTTKKGRGATASVGGGNVVAVGGQHVVTTTTGDTATTVKNAANATLKPDGTLVIGGARTTDTFKGKDDAGQPIKAGSTSKFANASISEKGIGGQGGMSRTNAAGSTHAGTVGAVVDPKGNVNVTASYSYQSKGGASFTPTASAGVEVQASDPIPAEGGGFDVTYTVTNSKALGFGVGKSMGGGPTVGAHMGSSEASLETGTVHFDDEKKATAFRDNAAAVIVRESHAHNAPSTVEGALQIPIGEERGSGNVAGSSKGGSVSFEGASLGYDRSESTTHKISVKRISKTVVHVTGMVSGTKGSDLTAGGGLTDTVGSSKTKGFSVTWEIDLGSPQGRIAFENYAKTGFPPVGGGGKMISMTTSGSEEDHENVSIPLLGTARWTGTAWEVITVNEKGTQEEFGGQQEHIQDPSWIGRKLGQDKIHSTAQIVSSVEKGKDGSEQESYEAKVEVSGDSGEANRNELGQMFMGVPHAGTAKSSGEWTLTAKVSKDVVEELAKSNKEMREATTKEDKMRVYSKLVKERGIKMVGAQVGLGGDATAWSLELKGDKNFPGPAGRAALDRLRATLKDRLVGDPAKARDVVKEVQRTLDELAARRKAVADRDRYTDLPDDLRIEQLKLIDKHISDFELLRHKASQEAIKVVPGQKPDAAHAGPADKGGPKTDQGAVEAEVAKLLERIGDKEAGIKRLDPRIELAIKAVQQAEKHMANMPPGYGKFAEEHRADYNMHWGLGTSINERQMAMEPKADALRMKLLGDLPPAERKSTAEALLGQITDRLTLLNALHTEVLGAAVAIKPITVEKWLSTYPKFWSSIQADAVPWAGGESD